MALTIGAVFVTHDAGNAFVAITAVWCLTALLLGIRPKWDDGYDIDRPFWQAALIVAGWIGVCALLVLPVWILAFYLAPSIALAVLVFTVARLVSRGQVRRDGR
ncbi:hypothetical protein [Gordonia neofelifaecis]|uniref:hypothetical protein n=1 Tax=Gordonia neofelifaecis TaxID=945692 RepID=UPI000317D8E5|nr:hypothetical protein [Gordonia neofelifaecis]